MEGQSTGKQEDCKLNPQAVNQMNSTLMAEFQQAYYQSPYYPAYPGMNFPYSTPKPKRQLNKFTTLEKLQAIERVNCGETKAHVARSTNVAESTLRGWFKNQEKLRSIYETEEMPMQAATSAMHNLPRRDTDFPESNEMLQAKSFHNYNYSWLEFFRNFENMPLQYFDTNLTSINIDEGLEYGRRFLRWMEDRLVKGDRRFNIHVGHLEEFRSLLADIFKGQFSERRQTIGDVKVKLEKPIERKHIVGDDDEDDD